MERRGAAVVIRDKDLTGEHLLDTVNSLLKEEQTLLQMAQASRELGRAEAADDIADLAIRLAAKR